MKNYKLLIFDWDGTIVDSMQLMIKCIYETAGQLHLKIPDEEQMQSCFGMSPKDFIKIMFPEVDEKLFYQCFYQYFSDEKLEKLFFVGAVETLNYLKNKGFRLAIATNKERPRLEAALLKANMSDLFSAMYCGDDGLTKPHPGVIQSLLARLGVSAAEALMIGDTVFDLQMAQSAGVDALAVAYGNSSAEQFRSYNPVAVISDIRELQTLF